VADFDVWWADPAWASPAHRALLDADERGRREALRRPADQDRFTVAAALLRLVGARATGLAPERVPVDRSCAQCGKPHGKPRIQGYDVHVSVSHSGGRVAVAAGPAELGVDVEEVAEVNVADLAGHTLGPGESAAGPADFFVYWTRKESVVKATGDGITVALSGVRVTRPDEPAGLVSYATRPGLVATVRDLRPGEGYAAALTVLAPEPVTVHEHDALPLLG
jgi:4'-phosphopantetheinyl transferase